MAENSPTYETHLAHAKALYRQRLSWMGEACVDMDSMLKLESRLRVHLHVLANSIDDIYIEPEQMPDTFVYLATCFTSEKEDVQEYAAQCAVQWLLETSPRSYAARDALILFKSPIIYKAMQDAYSSIEAMRPILFHILAQHGVETPKALLALPEEREVSALQEQVVFNAANNPDVQDDLFAHFYERLLKNRNGEIRTHQVLLSSIWGGMLRNKRPAIQALRKAIDQETDEMRRLDFVRLAAITGDNNFYPIIEQVLEHSLEYGFALLAINGSTESVERIFQGVSNPREAKDAVMAWWWVSGIKLDDKPRLTVVGDDAAGSNTNKIPDSSKATDWWNKQLNKHEQGIRWFRGNILSSLLLINELKNYSGMMSKDVQAVLSFHLSCPLLINNQAWHSDKLLQITKLETEVNNTQQPSCTSEVQRA